MKEYHKRSLIKAISYRLIGTIVTTLIVFIFTRKLSISLGVGSVDIIVKIIIYYLHERVWDKTYWGKIKE